MTTSDEKRIEELEEQVAHLSRANDELSTELVTQWKRIELLEARFERMQSRFSDLEEALDGGQEFDPAAEKPPHW